MTSGASNIRFVHKLKGMAHFLASLRSRHRATRCRAITRFFDGQANDGEDDQQKGADDNDGPRAHEWLHAPSAPPSTQSAASLSRRRRKKKRQIKRKMTTTTTTWRRKRRKRRRRWWR